MFAVGKNPYFTQWLQMEMDKREWSQSDCARACELNRAVINKLLNGKCKPQPGTLMAIARGFKIPVEAAFRAAGYLPPLSDGDDETQELLHIFHRLQSPQRRATAIMLVKTLLTEEENLSRADGKARR